MSVGQTLTALLLLENPLAKTDDYRMYVISHLSQLEKLDKDPITAEEKSAALEKVRNLFMAVVLIKPINANKGFSDHILTLHCNNVLFLGI